MLSAEHQNFCLITSEEEKHQRHNVCDVINTPHQNMMRWAVNQSGSSVWQRKTHVQRREEEEQQQQHKEEENEEEQEEQQQQQQKEKE